MFIDDGYRVNKRLDYNINGRNRISDGTLFTPLPNNDYLFVELPEVKARKSLSLSSQLKDAVEYTEMHNLQYRIITLQGTKLSRPVTQLTKNYDHVFIHEISPERIFKAGNALGFW